ARLQVSRQFLAAGVEDDRLADYHGIAAEAACLGLARRDQMRNVIFDHPASVAIESIGIPQRFTGCQRAKACIEMVKVGIDQLQRQYLFLQCTAEILMPLHIAANAIAGEQRRTTKQGISCSLEVHPFRQMLDAEAVRREPSIEVRRLAGTFFMAKPRAEKSLAEHQARIRREH